MPDQPSDASRYLPPDGFFSRPAAFSEDRVCVLVSGGADSTVLLAEQAAAHAEVFPVYIREGLVWEAVELHRLRQLLDALPAGPIMPLTILDVPVQDLYAGHWSVTANQTPGWAAGDDAVYLPGRNILLLAKTALFCAANRIGTMALALLGSNPFPDGQRAFLDKFADALGEGLGCQFRILAPFAHEDKKTIVRKGLSLGLPMHLTFSCIAPQGLLHCGRCEKCEERRKGFAAAGVEDLTEYAAPPPVFS